jgi:rhamnosyltransferase
MKSFEDKPRLCIAMALYNAQAHLREQLESILSQSYDDFRLLVCDDCSQDSSVGIVEEYAERDSRIVLLRNPVRLGAVKNFERLLGLCDCRYIALSDQDDIWERERLQKGMDALESAQERYGNVPMAVHSDLSMIDSEGRKIADSFMKKRGYGLSGERDFAHILGPNGVMGNTLLFNEELKREILPFPETLAVHDYWIALNCELFGRRIYIDEPLVRYRIHEKNLSNPKSSFGASYLFGHLKAFLKGEPALPYRGIAREKVIEKVLERDDIGVQERVLMEEFLDYLHLRGGRMGLFRSMCRNGTIKSSPIYRFFFLLGLLRARE